MSQIAAISADQMKLVLDVSRLLTVTADLDTLLTRIAEAASSLLCAERASIFLHDPETQELWTKVALGATTIRVPCSAGIVGHVFQTNRLLHVPDPYNDARFNREVDRKNGFVTRSLLTAPLKDMNDMPLGVLQVVNRIGGAFTDGDHAMIELLADQAGVAIQRYRLQQEVIRTAGLRHEMDLAYKVQVAMIPEHPPEIPRIRAVGWTKPASVTGGDSYDLWRVADRQLGIFLGDASGHGIAPAIVISQVRTLVRALADIQCDPTWLLTKVNDRLATDLEAGRFATVFVGCVSSDGLLKWSSAGHGPLLWKRSGDAPFELLEPLGPPIGVLPELNCDPTGSLLLEPGGMLVVISDGIFESPDSNGELFEIGRVVALLDQCKGQSPGEMLSRLRHDVRQWQGNDEPEDDQTVVIVQRDPE